MNKVETVEIDVAKVLKEKAPTVKLPKFVINYLRKIVHEEEFNAFFKENKDLKNLDFIEAGLKTLDVTVSVKGEENLPFGSQYIFASNHPLGGLDGIAIGYVLGKFYDRKIRFFSNDILMNVHPLKEMFVPVNKSGAQAKSNAEMMKNLYESDHHLLTYPSGMCSRKINGKIVDLEWKKNFIKKSIEYQRDIVPIFFEGQNSNFFYNLANIRKMLGIKTNIEMFYLVDEMFKQRGNHFVVNIGKPIPWQTFDKSKTHQEWANWMKEVVYKISK